MTAMNSITIEIDLLGATYPAEVQYETDVDTVDITAVRITYTHKKRYNARGEWEPRDKQRTVDVLGLLNSQQIKSLVAEITESLQEEPA
jgi:hypothetical protein